MFRIWTILLGSLTLAACASTGATPEPFPTPGRRAPSTTVPPPPTGPVDGYAVTQTALGLRGAPYRNGGSDPTGFDCSGFVWYVFAQHGASLPRTVSEQFALGAPVPPSALVAGDLVFFDTGGRGVSHVGLAIGGDQFIHAPSGRGEVRVERIGSSYWGPRFAGARRLQ